MKRFGSICRLKPEGAEVYIRQHAQVHTNRPEVVAMIRKCNIRNYSIFHKDGFVFSYFEYVGKDYEKDMARMAADPKTQEWWALVKPLMDPLPTRAEGEWWANMDTIFRLD